MAQRLRVPTAFIESTDLIPSTYMLAHNCLYVQFQGIHCPLDFLWVPDT